MRWGYWHHAQLGWEWNGSLETREEAENALAVAKSYIGIGGLRSEVVTEGTLPPPSGVSDIIHIGPRGYGWDGKHVVDLAPNTEAVGVKHDSGKLRWDLLPWSALEQIVRVLMHGAEKYGDNNWQKVTPHRPRYFSAAMRHLVDWFLGKKKDDESGLHPLAHAGACILFLLSRDDEHNG